MRYTGPATIHLTEDEAKSVLLAFDGERDALSEDVRNRMRYWLAYRTYTRHTQPSTNGAPCTRPRNS